MLWHCIYSPSLYSGSAIVWQIQRWMLTANYWTEHCVPNVGDGERTEGAEGLCNHIGRKTISTNQTPQSSQGLNHQQKSTDGGTRGSCCICSSGWPCLASMGEEALGPVKAQFPSIWECLKSEVGVGAWMVEHPHRSRGNLNFSLLCMPYMCAEISLSLSPCFSWSWIKCITIEVVEVEKNVGHHYTALIRFLLIRGWDFLVSKLV